MQKNHIFTCVIFTEWIMYMQQKINIAICKTFLFDFFGFDWKYVTMSRIKYINK